MILPILALVWVTIGSGLAWVTLWEFHAPEKQPAREAWRRERLDRFHADTLGDFLRSGLGMLWVLCIVIALWPMFLWQTLRSNPQSGKGRDSRQ